MCQELEYCLWQKTLLTQWYYSLLTLFHAVAVPALYLRQVIAREYYYFTRSRSHVGLNAYKQSLRIQPEQEAGYLNLKQGIPPASSYPGATTDSVLTLFHLETILACDMFVNIIFCLNNSLLMLFFNAIPCQCYSMLTLFHVDTIPCWHYYMSTLFNADTIP
jgi:hypothetical protein